MLGKVCSPHQQLCERDCEDRKVALLHSEDWASLNIYWTETGMMSLSSL